MIVLSKDYVKTSSLICIGMKAWYILTKISEINFPFVDLHITQVLAKSRDNLFLLFVRIYRYIDEYRRISKTDFESRR